MEIILSLHARLREYDEKIKYQTLSKQSANAS